MHILAGVVLLTMSLAAQVAYTVAHRRPVDPRRPPSPSVRLFRLVYPVLMLGLFGVALDQLFLAGRWSGTWPPSPLLVWSGIACMIGGVVLFGWARRSLGDQYSPCFAARQPTVVVRLGPYRWFRHPMYLGNLVAIAGAVMATGSLLLAILWSVVALCYWRAASTENMVIAAIACPASED
jgi:protein-S-isoprenylcysteine O-methyltransferase Ste14